jgi:hypothetical protein
MKGDPVLRYKTWQEERGVTHDDMRLRVYGGVHYIKGNSKPYFSLTGQTWRNGREDCGGCIHDVILRHFPELADLAAMHMSDIDGAPMHDAANGWYNFAGYLGGAGERYHVGNSERHFPIEPPAGKTWPNTEYRKPTQDECLRIWAEHVRIPFDEALKVAAQVSAHWNFPDQKKAHAEWIGQQRKRWRAEADACIVKHKLVVYGDKWPVD